MPYSYVPPSSFLLPSLLLFFVVFFFFFFLYLFNCIFLCCRYLHLLTLITKIHLAFICFYAGGIIAEGITSTFCHSSSSSFIFFFIFFLSSSFIFFLSSFNLLFIFQNKLTHNLNLEFLWTRIMFGYVVIIANNVIYGTSPSPFVAHNLILPSPPLASSYLLTSAHLRSPALTCSHLFLCVINLSSQ